MEARDVLRSTQNTSEIVPSLKSPTGKHRYRASVLAGVLLFAQVQSGIAAILPVLHVDASNDKITTVAYIAKYL